KASTSSENDTLINTSPLPTQMMLIQNNEMMEPPKNSTIVLPFEKAIIAPAADSHDDQDITMQQCDQTQDTQKVIEHVQETTIDEMGNIEKARKAVLEDESIYIDSELTDTGPTKKDDDAHSITSHTTPHRIDTDANSNATIEGTKIPHCLYSSVLKNKDQILQKMEVVDSTGWPDTVKTYLNNKRKALQKFQIPEPLLLSYTNINYTDKPNLSEDPKHIIGIGLVTLIRDPKTLVIMAWRLWKLYFFHKLPEHWIEIKELTGTSTKYKKPVLSNDLNTLLEKLCNTKDTLHIPITDYSKLNDTLEWL
ncbi:32349_t:CDS:2, partial [Gigaspora margarita]